MTKMMARFSNHGVAQRFLICLVMALVPLPVYTSAQTTVPANPWKAEFIDPPLSSRPFTWWHWMNGNITKDGITRDLQWMKDFGLGGAIVFNVGMLGDHLPRKVPFDSDDWWGMVDHAILEADRLGLKLGFHNCDGWSHSGGPWMTPELSMKKLVLTESFAREGDTNVVVEQPETLEGFYRDIAILAMPVNESAAEVVWDRSSSNLPAFRSETLNDKDLKTVVNLRNIKSSDPIQIDFRFDELTPIGTIQLTTAGGNIKGFEVEIKVSEDADSFRTVNRFDANSRGNLGWKSSGGRNTFSLSFPQQRVKALRVMFKTCDSFDLAEVSLFEAERVDRWEQKAGLFHYTEHGGADETYVPDRDRYDHQRPKSVIQSSSIIDLTSKLRDGNLLRWTAPAGNWRVVRFGFTSTGKTNGPSTVEGRGLEADKLDPAALTRHYDGFMKRMVGRSINQSTDSLAYTEIDSWEAGISNWTAQMPTIFRQLNGYDMHPYLPLLIGGHIVDNYEVSERFLSDFRRTVAHLIRTGCFQTLIDNATRDGLTAFAEGSGRQQYLYDPINYQSTAPIPKGEFWVGRDGGANLDATSAWPMRPRIDCKVASSVAHIYGGQLAASESFTGGSQTWKMGPYDNKMVGDLAYTMGVNFIVLHTSAHQPYSHLKPGFSLGGAGSHFHRNNLVYSASNAWPLYMARCQHLLRQGTFVADVLYFTGEQVPNYLGFREELPVPLPEGYDYDGCNAEIILNQARVEGGRIVLKSGMQYRVLLLPDQTSMSQELLAGIRRLVSNGATIIGPKPVRAIGLRNYPAQDATVKSMAAEVWGDCDGVMLKEHRFGRGRVIWGKSFDEIFSDFDLQPDFSYETADKHTLPVSYIHRRDGENEIYFVVNSEDKPTTINARFRLAGKVPTLYCPDTGQILSVAHYQSNDGMTNVPLTLEPCGSVFVVFQPGNHSRSVTKVDGGTPALLSYDLTGAITAEFPNAGTYQLVYSDGTRDEVVVDLPKSFSVNGPWDIRFPMNAKVSVDSKQSELFSWADSEDPSIRYFSGTAVYSKTFELPEGYRADGQKLYLDLGDVQKIARVRVNGTSCPDLWKPPFKTEVTNLLTVGVNRIEIEVTNTWANRMIGDARLPPDVQYTRYPVAFPDWLDGTVARQSDRQTFTVQQFFEKNDALLPSGLIGPVTINATRLLKL